MTSVIAGYAAGLAHIWWVFAACAAVSAVCLAIALVQHRRMEPGA